MVGYSWITTAGVIFSCRIFSVMEEKKNGTWCPNGSMFGGEQIIVFL
jgi:hypothetical protein